MKKVLKCTLFVLGLVLILGLIVPSGALAERVIKIGVMPPAVNCGRVRSWPPRLPTRR